MADGNGYPMGRVRHIHLVGIGGAGMSGIAEVLHNLGYEVSGSDVKDSPVIGHLRELGVHVRQGHEPGHVNGSDVLVVSGAIGEDNPELQAARSRRIPVIPRAEMLAELMRFRHGIAVAGTHGKTTTTSLIASLLAEGGQDPTYVIGGRLNSSGRHAKLGAGRYLVAEADESDASFLHLQPVISVVTNIDTDHLATYGGDFLHLKSVFIEFLHHLPFYGLAVLCADDAGVREILPRISKPVVTYGIDADADVRATDVSISDMRSRFTVALRDQPRWLTVELNLPGRHNVRNALAAIAVCRELGIDAAAMQKGLAEFQGIGRRFELLGEASINGGRVRVIDDYGHHPAELAATLEAIHEAWPGHRVVTVFQPHRYTRTHDLFDDFCAVLSRYDALVMLDVYAAGESAITGADSAALCRALRQRGQVEPVLAGSQEEVLALLPAMVRDGDVLLVQGAGDIGALGPRLMQRLAGGGHGGNAG